MKGVKAADNKIFYKIQNWVKDKKYKNNKILIKSKILNKNLIQMM